MGRKDEHAENRSKAGRQNCAEYPHAQGKNEYIIQNHIGKASPDHRRHGQLRCPIVADKAQKYIIQQEDGSKQQNHLHIRLCHGKNRFIRTQQMNKRFG